MRALSQIVPVVVSDEEATAACVAFADERRMLVEPACGAALAVLERSEFRCEPGPHGLPRACSSFFVLWRELSLAASVPALELAWRRMNTVWRGGCMHG